MPFDVQSATAQLQAACPPGHSVNGLRFVPDKPPVRNQQGQLTHNEPDVANRLQEAVDDTDPLLLPVLNFGEVREIDTTPKGQQQFVQTPHLPTDDEDSKAVKPNYFGLGIPTANQAFDNQPLEIPQLTFGETGDGQRG